ncbi:MAG: hypothetical protein LBP72_03665 [Dysgonamonadaceae bacterium]|jgi:hypothetical protein|nr:hypothetical protein [Dysgonamonadaceae bacterium]
MATSVNNSLLCILNFQYLEVKELCVHTHSRFKAKGKRYKGGGTGYKVQGTGAAKPCILYLLLFTLYRVVQGACAGAVHERAPHSLGGSVYIKTLYTHV